MSDIKKEYGYLDSRQMNHMTYGGRTSEPAKLFQKIKKALKNVPFAILRMLGWLAILMLEGIGVLTLIFSEPREALLQVVNEMFYCISLLRALL